MARPRLYAADYKNHDVVERAVNHIKNWHGLAPRNDKHALVCRGGVVLAAILLWQAGVQRRALDPKDSRRKAGVLPRLRTGRNGYSCSDWQPDRGVGLRCRRVSGLVGRPGSAMHSSPCSTAPEVASGVPQTVMARRADRFRERSDHCGSDRHSFGGLRAPTKRRATTPKPLVSSQAREPGVRARHPPAQT